MSIRTDPMRAVPVLLKRVKTARTILDQRRRDESLDGKLEKLTREMNKIEDVFMRVKKNQDELVDTLHEVDGHLRKLDRKRLDQDMDHFCKRIRDCAHKLLPMEAFESDSSKEEHNTEIVQASHDSSSSQHKKEFLLYKDVNLNLDVLERLEHPLRVGMLPSRGEKTEEEDGEDVIDELLKLNIIVPYGNGKCPLFKKFKLNPHAGSKLVQYVPRKEHLHHLGYYLQMLQYYKWSWLVLSQQKVTLGDGDHLKLDNFIRIFFNVGVRYLNIRSQWLDKSKNLRVLQLGRWQDSPSHHIEVGNEEFLEKIKDLLLMKYLSLRGILRIFKLPLSIAQHHGLEILDLKACHNLETLPDDISSMTSLTHLILSQCYFLDGMPKGIEKLTKLEVLKGFIIGSSRKTPCRISDLVNLKKLRQLSIRIGSDAVIKDREFESLGELSFLKHLKISWGMSDTRYNDIQIILPSSLKRLHLEGFPGPKIPMWLKPSELPSGLKELKIIGGNLESMNHDEHRNK